jgi:transposase
MASGARDSLAFRRVFFHGKSKFEALRLRRGHRRAIVAIAHKILKTVFLLIRRQTHYRDSVVDFEAMSVTRNAPRWLKMLRKHGFIPAAA